MLFRTQVELPERKIKIRHSDRLMLIGSCFANNIGDLLQMNKFVCTINPFGVLYNPMSIAKALRQLMEKKVYACSDVFESNGMWHSWMHHSTFSSDVSAEECVRCINEHIVEGHEALMNADWLLLTLGTAYVYERNGEVVGNCHKQPDKMFHRFRLNTEDIIGEFRNVLKMLRKKNPGLKIIFTISPIRHSKDGMHGNQLSKSTLLLAVDKLCAELESCHYFPSYEIMMDELRDYRFYADDMLHPSNLAIEYIWKCFCNACFNEETLSVMKEWEEIRKALHHKPFHPHSDAYRSFLTQILLKIQRMKEKLPYIEPQKEIELCQTLLKI